MIVTFPPDVEKKIVALAASRKLEPSSFVFSLVEEEWGKQYVLQDSKSFHDVDEDFDPEALNRMLAAMINRTPEQIKAAQEMAIREFQPERELPAGAKNIFDVIPVIRGNETDEQVLQDLRELS